MNEIEKAIEWLSDNKICMEQEKDKLFTAEYKVAICEHILFMNLAIEALKEIENLKSENAELKARLKKSVELPLKLGQEVYMIERKKPKEFKVCFIGLCGDGKVQIHLSWFKDKDNFKTLCCMSTDIGKTVFLTRAEAEKALEEMEK